MSNVDNLRFALSTYTIVVWGSVAATLLGSTLADWKKKREEEEVAREENFGDGRNGKKGKGGGDTGYHSQIQAKQYANPRFLKFAR